MEITFQFLTQYSNECFYSGRNPQARPLKVMLEEINKVIDTSEIKVIYPKNLFVDDKQVEIYLFTDKRHIMKVTYENREVHTYLYFPKDIVNFSSKVNFEENSRSSVIKFSNSEMIELNSLNDTNTYHTYRFEELIIGIWKLFLSGNVPVKE